MVLDSIVSIYDMLLCRMVLDLRQSKVLERSERK